MDTYNTIEKALKFIAENFKTQPSLKELADICGLSEYHFQKVFTEWAGISPKKFLSYTNITYAKDLLSKNGSIEDATYNNGLSSTSRLHDLFVSIDAMTPAEYKNKGENLNIHYSIYKSKFGDFLVASTSKGICEVIFADKEKLVNELTAKWGNANIIKKEEPSHVIVKDFINNKKSNQKIHLHLKGTNFQIKVWEALLKIPEGNLSTYGNIAKELSTKGYRAVGTAIGDNHIAFIIPCHRVIKSTGVFGNYRWGAEKKLAMLGYEMGISKDL